MYPTISALTTGAGALLARSPASVLSTTLPPPVPVAGDQLHLWGWDGPRLMEITLVHRHQIRQCGASDYRNS